jgi:hypothetical protein
MYLFLLYTAPLQPTSVSLASLPHPPTPPSSLLRHRVVCVSSFFPEIFIYRYHLPLSLSIFPRNEFVFLLRKSPSSLLCYRSLSLQFTLVLPPGVRQSRLAGGRGGRVLGLPLFLSWEGLDSSFRFWFCFFGFHLLSYIESALPPPLSST